LVTARPEAETAIEDDSGPTIRHVKWLDTTALRMLPCPSDPIQLLLRTTTEQVRRLLAAALGSDARRVDGMYYSQMS